MLSFLDGTKFTFSQLFHSFLFDYCSICCALRIGYFFLLCGLHSTCFYRLTFPSIQLKSNKPEKNCHDNMDEKKNSFKSQTIGHFLFIVIVTALSAQLFAISIFRRCASIWDTYENLMTCLRSSRKTHEFYCLPSTLHHEAIIMTSVQAENDASQKVHYDQTHMHYQKQRHQIVNLQTDIMHFLLISHHF